MLNRYQTRVLVLLVSKSKELFPKIPCYILKENQILISISSLDFSFTINDKTKSILNLLSKNKIKIKNNSELRN